MCSDETIRKMELKFIVVVQTSMNNMQINMIQGDVVQTSISRVDKQDLE